MLGPGLSAGDLLKCMTSTSLSSDRGVTAWGLPGGGGHMC